MDKAMSLSLLRLSDSGGQLSIYLACIFCLALDLNRPLFLVLH